MKESAELIIKYHPINGKIVFSRKKGQELLPITDGPLRKYQNEQKGSFLLKEQEASFMSDIVQELDGAEVINIQFTGTENDFLTLKFLAEEYNRSISENTNCMINTKMISTLQSMSEVFDLVITNAKEIKGFLTTQKREISEYYQQHAKYDDKYETYIQNMTLHSREIEKQIEKLDNHINEDKETMAPVTQEAIKSIEKILNDTIKCLTEMENKKNKDKGDTANKTTKLKNNITMKIDKILDEMKSENIEKILDKLLTDCGFDQKNLDDFLSRLRKVVKDEETSGHHRHEDKAEKGNRELMRDLNERLGERLKKLKTAKDSSLRYDREKLIEYIFKIEELDLRAMEEEKEEIQIDPASSNWNWKTDFYYDYKKDKKDGKINVDKENYRKNVMKKLQDYLYKKIEDFKKEFRNEREKILEDNANIYIEKIYSYAVDVSTAEGERQKAEKMHVIIASNIEKTKEKLQKTENLILGLKKRLQ
jgi:hypothetical protein